MSPSQFINNHSNIVCLIWLPGCYYGGDYIKIILNVNSNIQMVRNLASWAIYYYLNNKQCAMVYDSHL